MRRGGVKKVDFSPIMDFIYGNHGSKIGQISFRTKLDLFCLILKADFRSILFFDLGYYYLLRLRQRCLLKDRDHKADPIPHTALELQ